MRPTLSIRMLLRSPLKTLLMVALLAGISFALFLRISEYSLTAGEFERTKAAYRGVGIVEIAPAEYFDIGSPKYLTGTWYNPDNSLDGTWEGARYPALTAEQMDAVAALPYITSTSTRYMTAGVSSTYKRVDAYKTFYDYTTRHVFEGTLGACYYTEPDASRREAAAYERVMEGRFEDIVPLTENPFLPVTDFGLGYTFYLLNRAEYGEALREGLPEWYNYFPWDFKQKINGGMLYSHRFAEWYSSSSPRSSGGTAFPHDFTLRDSMVLGERYLYVVDHYKIFNFTSESVVGHAWPGDTTAEYWCDILIPLSGQPENYLETDAFADIRLLIDITNQDYYTFDVVYTDDMAAIPRFNERKMGIRDGRALADTDEGAKVCVISAYVADKYKLSVGDSFPLGLCDTLFEQHAGLGAVAVTRGRYSTPVKEVNLEIVGIYTDYDSEKAQGMMPHWAYSANTVFVPLSMLPASADTANTPVKPGAFSFTVGDVDNIPKFMAEAAPALAEMGLTVRFSEEGR